MKTGYVNGNILIPLADAVALNQATPPWKRTGYRKILVPLDGSEDSEKVLDGVQALHNQGTMGILLRVIHPGKSRVLGENLVLVSKQEEARRAKAMGYLRCVGGQLVKAPGRWRYEVVVSDSVAQGIVDFAVREEVDLIAMYTHDRRGLAKLIKGSIAEQVQRRTPTEIRVLTPRGLAITTETPTNGDRSLKRQILEDAEAFGGPCW